MRVALFGGTFDPIHRGHLAIATSAAEAFALDRVLFAPTGRQPLKSTSATAPFTDRLAMASLACTGDPRFEACDLDAPHADERPNYTVDLLGTVAREHPSAILYAIAGLDSFLTLPRWREPRRLLSLAEWIVVSRPGSSFETLSPAFDLAGVPLTPSERARIHPLDWVHEEVSATSLRERLRRGDACTDVVPALVSAHIETHNLYH